MRTKGGMVTKAGRANAHGKHASGVLVSGSRKDEVGVGGRKPRLLLTALVSVAWVALVFGHTNAYLWPIILAAAVAVYGAWKFDGWSALRRAERVAFVALAVLLAVGASLANYAQMSMARSAVFLVLGIPVFLQMLCGLWGLLNGYAVGEAADAEGLREPRVFLGYFAFLAAAYLLCLLLCGMPGTSTEDSAWQMSQLLTGQFDNHHPFWHTMLIGLVFSPTLALTGSVFAAALSYSVLQSLMQAAVLALGLSTLRRLGQPGRRTWLLALGYAVLPQFLTYACVMWKDIPFALACLLLVVACVRLRRRVGGARSNLAFLALGLLGVCVLRNNGIYVAIVYVPIALALLRGCDRLRTAAVTMFVVLALGLFMRYPAIGLLGVSSTDGPRESLSVPIQQIARVSAEGGLTAQETDSLRPFLPMDEVPTLYVPYKSNAVKFRMDDAYLNAHLRDFLAIWVQVGLEHPRAYLCAWVDQTVGYWYSGYQYWFWVWQVSQNDFGLTWAGGPLQRPLILYLALYGFDNPFALFVSIGVMDILTVIALVFGALRRRRDVVLTALPSVLVLLTLLVATPVFCEYRYAYCVSVTLPFLVGLLLCVPRGADSDCEGGSRDGGKQDSGSPRPRGHRGHHPLLQRGNHVDKAVDGDESDRAS